MEGFEEFDQYHSRSVKTLFVTIQCRGNFSLNRAAFKALGEPVAVKLFYNRSKHLIGFRSADPSEPRSVPVRRQGHSQTYMVAGLTFTKEYDIDTSVALRYSGKVQDNMLIIDLNEESTIATGPRAQNDTHGGLQGKQERRLARRIAERTPASGNGSPMRLESSAKESQPAATVQEAKDILSQEDKAALEKALRQGEVSTVDELFDLVRRVHHARTQPQKKN